MASSEMDYMNIGKGNVIGIDTTNIVHTFTRGTGSTSVSDVDTWTADQDCILCGFLTYNNAQSGQPSYITIDGVIVQYYYLTGTNGYTGVWIPLKKGQTVQMLNYLNAIGNVKAYAPKY